LISGNEPRARVSADYFPALTLDGKTYSFEHLNPFTFSFHSQLAKRTLSVHVTFSNHCFSKAYDIDSHAVGEPIIGEEPRPRTFCSTRYRLSLGLPAIVAGMNHPHIKVWQTAAQRNWAYSLRIEDPEGPYHVFFEVRRAGATKPQDLNLVVESAYHQTDAAPKLFGRMGFMLLCSKVYLRQPTTTRR
jgi:hypothetical protein